MRQISEGAEARIFECDVAGIPAVAKVRMPKEYRNGTLDGRIRESRTKAEARITQLAAMNGVNSPSLLLCGGHYLVVSRIDGILLSRGLQDRSMAQALEGALGEAGRQLALMHSLDIAHGDFTPANVMVGKDGRVWVIDFGLSEITKSVEGIALDVLLMKRSLDRAQFRKFLEGYEAQAGASRCREVVGRMEGVERRGRYQTRSLDTGRAKEKSQ